MAIHRIGLDPAELQRRRSERASKAGGQADVPAEVEAYIRRNREGRRSIPTPGAPALEPETVAAPAGPAPAAKVAPKSASKDAPKATKRGGK